MPKPPRTASRDVAARVPAEAQARREVQRRIGQRLPVVAEPQIEREVVAHANAVLRIAGDEPLAQFVARDAVVDRLRVLLHVGQRQLVERRRRRVEEGEGAEHREAGLVAGAAGRVANQAAAEPDRVPAARPRQRVRELRTAGRRDRRHATGQW